MRTFLLRRLCMLAFVCMAAFSVLSAQSASNRFIVGVLQENGAIIPFARYDGTRWLNTWPAPRDPIADRVPLAVPTPREWLGGDPTTSWRLWLMQF